MATPYIGSKICLISKAEIRYEGILYTIDSKESTVALAKVRAFGTEDRKAETQFPALDEIFEYIIFKAADIKEIRVCQPPMSSVASDPAIVSHSLAPGQPGPPPGPGPSFGDFSGTPYANQPPMFLNQSPFGGGLGLSPSSILSPPSSNLPTSDTPLGYSAKAESCSQSLAEGSRTSSPEAAKAHVERQRENESSDEPKKNQKTVGQSNFRGNQRENYQQRDGYQRRGPSGGYSGQSGPPARPRGAVNRGPNQRGPPRRQSNKEPLKFDEEFDFEQANLEFQELESKMAKTKITDGEENEDVASWEGEEEKQDDAKGSAEKENEEEPPGEYYNRSKSFFDKISCEALEREKGINNGRVDWRHERNINKETFGVSAPPNRGGYRNRNNWQGGGGGGGGGYNNYGYRNGGHFGGGGGSYRGNRNGGGYNNGPRNYHEGRNYGGHRGGGGGYGGGYGHYDNRNRNNGPRGSGGPRGPRPSHQQQQQA